MKACDRKPGRGSSRRGGAVQCGVVALENENEIETKTSVFNLMISDLPLHRSLKLDSPSVDIQEHCYIPWDTTFSKHSGASSPRRSSRPLQLPSHR